MVARELMDQLVNAGGSNAYVMKSPIYASKLSGLNATYLAGGKSETFDALQTRLKFDDEVTQPEVPAAPKEQIHYERSKPTKRELPAERFKISRSGNNGIDPRCSQSGSAAHERVDEESTFEVKITPPKRKQISPKVPSQTDRSQP